VKLQLAIFTDTQGRPGADAVAHGHDQWRCSDGESCMEPAPAIQLQLRQRWTARSAASGHQVDVTISSLSSATISRPAVLSSTTYRRRSCLSRLITTSPTPSNRVSG
jgi:hypothetical protein